jgi:hypothetical protein
MKESRVGSAHASLIPTDQKRSLTDTRAQA